MHRFTHPFCVCIIMSLDESSVKSLMTGLDRGGDDSTCSTNIEPSVASNTDTECQPINSI